MATSDRDPVMPHFEVDLTEDDLVLAKEKRSVRKSSTRQTCLKYLALIVALVFGIILVGAGGRSLIYVV